MEHFLIYIDR